MTISTPSQATGNRPQEMVDTAAVTEKPSVPSEPNAEGEESSDARRRSSSTENKPPQSENKADAEDATANGNPLDRVPSQANKLGKKKIAVVMGALCVWLESWVFFFNVNALGRTADLFGCMYSLFCFWRLWIWCDFSAL